MNILKPQVSITGSNIDNSVAFYEKVFQIPGMKRRLGCADPDGNSWEVFVAKGETSTMEKLICKSGRCVPNVQGAPDAKASGGCCG
jgi:hypothetical protein